MTTDAHTHFHEFRDEWSDECDCGQILCARCKIPIDWDEENKQYLHPKPMCDVHYLMGSREVDSIGDTTP